MPGPDPVHSRAFPLTDLSKPTLLVVPDDMADAASVLAVRQAVAAKAGRAPDIVAQKDFATTDFKSAQVIACGNIVNNRAVRRLYNARYCFADTFFPGSDGYFIRSISDPFGHGLNAVAVGTSTGEGLSRALPVFTDIIATTDGRFGRVHAAAIDHQIPPLPDDSELEAMVQRDLDTWSGDWASSPFRAGRVQDYAWHFYLTDHPVWGRAVAEILTRSIEPWREDRRADPEGYHCFFNLHSFIHLWDLIEDSPLFSDRDRQGVVSLLCELLRHLSGLFYLREDVNPAGEIRQNHTTFIGLDLAVGHRYLSTRYGIQEFQVAAEAAERIFAGQADCYKPNDDGGVGYAWIVPYHTLLYYLLDDDTRYIDNGHVADLCRLAVVTADNMRSEGNYGDTGGYPRFAADRWDSRMWPLMVSTSLGSDPEHLWMLKWLGEGKRPPLSRALSGLYSGVAWSQEGMCLGDVDPRGPDGLLGISPVELPGPVLKWVADHAPAARRPDPGKTYFDKLSLRSGFEPRDEYLLLEGLGTCCHGHEDANALVRLTWNDRAWIGEGDYIRAAPKFHNSVVVLRNGVGVLDPAGDGLLMPPLSSLNYTDDGPDFAMVQSEVAGYNGVSWLRNIFWRKGRYFAFVDRLVCSEGGDYACRCLWRLMGETELGGHGTVLRQDGETFYVRTAGHLAQEILPDLHEKGKWGGYPYSDGIPRVLHQTQNRAMEPGDALSFVNLLTPHEGIEIRELAGGFVGIVDGDEETILSVGGGSLGDLEVDGDMFRATLRGDVLTTQGEARITRASRQALDQDLVRAIREAMAGTLEAPQIGRGRSTSTPDGAITSLWDCRLPGPVADVSVFGETLIVGTEDGQVARIDAATGTQAWTTRLDGEPIPTCVLATDLKSEGDPTAIVGTSDSRLFVLDGANGTQRWCQPLRNMGNRSAGASALAVADLDGSGDRSVLAGTHGWYVNAFAADGTAKWANWIRYHAITGLAVADADGDGKAEVMVGTEYSTPLTVHNHDGSFRWSTFEEVGSEGNATTPRRGIGLTQIALCDLDGDGVVEIVYGTADGWIYAVKPQDGSEVWHAAVVGEVVGLSVHADAVVVASEYGWLYGFSYAGELVWQIRDSDWLSGMALAGDRIITTTEGGILRAYDLGGSTVGSTSAGAEVGGIWAAGDRVVCSAIEEGRLSCFEVCD